MTTETSVVTAAPSDSQGQNHVHSHPQNHIQRNTSASNGRVRTLSRPAAQAVAGALDSLFSPAVASPRALLANPFEAMHRMQRDMDRLFDALSSDYERSNAASSGQNSRWTPRLEAFDREGQLIVRAELPGLKREEIDVKVEDGVLLLSGERKNERQNENSGFFHSEIAYGAFARAIPLPETAEIEKISAQFIDGILEISIPNAAPVKRSHQVNIS